jgi:hypothetical protein
MRPQGSGDESSAGDAPLSRAMYRERAAFERRLRQVAAEWLKARGFPQRPRTPYVLEGRDRWRDNIIVPEVARYIEAKLSTETSAGRRHSLHRWVHDGLSSQAMLFNLVGPLIVTGDFSPLRQAFVAAGLPFPVGQVCAEFEYQDPGVFSERVPQPTSIDLMVAGRTDRARLFVEAKLTERGFGGCSVFGRKGCDGSNPAADVAKCYLHQAGRLYWEVLRQQGFTDGLTAGHRRCVLADHYQFFREVCFALAKGGVFVLLMDERNPLFAHRRSDQEPNLMDRLCGMVPANLRERVTKISVQQIVAAIKESPDHRWVAAFEEKYGLL